MMVLINKQDVSARATYPASVTVLTKGLYFNLTAERYFGLEEQVYLHFLNDGSKWFFYLDQSKDGFQLVRTESAKGLFAFSTGLVRMFQNSTGHKDKRAVFYIQDTKNYHQGNRLIEILTDKPINKIGK